MKQAKKDIRIRQHLMERSFARACRYGFKRSRWRRLWRNQVQEYLTAAIQNIMILVSHIEKPREVTALAMVETRQQLKRNVGNTLILFKECLGTVFTATLETFCNRIWAQTQLQNTLWSVDWATARQDLTPRIFFWMQPQSNHQSQKT